MRGNHGTVTTEHAILMSDGSMQVFNDHPEIERIHPLADRIQHQQRTGCTVYHRRIVVVDAWEELPPR